MIKQHDFFGREIKDGDFVLRAKNAGRSYTMNVLLVVDLDDGKRKYIELSSRSNYVSKNANPSIVLDTCCQSCIILLKLRRAI